MTGDAETDGLNVCMAHGWFMNAGWVDGGGRQALVCKLQLVLEALFKVVLLAPHNCHIAGSMNAIAISRPASQLGRCCCCCIAL